MKRTSRPRSLRLASRTARAGSPSRPGAARLLVVGLEARRQRPVPDRAHVGLVDAHPERVGGDHDVGLAAHERVLRAGAGIRGHAGVVGGRLQALGAEQLGDLLGALAGSAIDDRGAVLFELEARDERSSFAGDGSVTVEREDVEAEVRAVEARSHSFGLPEAEPGDDLLRDLGRRGRRAGHRGRVAELLDDRGQAQVVRAEIVAPLGHAMGLVDDEQGDPALRDRVSEGGATRSARGRRRRRSPGRRGSGRAPAGCRRLTRASPRGGRGPSAARPGRASGRSGGRRRRSGRRSRAPAAGNRGSCRRRWA